MVRRAVRPRAGAPLVLALAAALSVGTALAQPGSRAVVGLQAEPVTLDVGQLSDYNASRAAMEMYEGVARFAHGSTDIEAGRAEGVAVAGEVHGSPAQRRAR